MGALSFVLVKIYKVSSDLNCPYKVLKSTVTGHKSWRICSKSTLQSAITDILTTCLRKGHLVDQKFSTIDSNHPNLSYLVTPHL